MTLQNIFNLASLFINMIGAFMMYHYTPKISSGIFLYQQEELREKKKKDVYKNNMVRLGMFLLFIGFLLQLVAFNVLAKPDKAGLLE